MGEIKINMYSRKPYELWDESKVGIKKQWAGGGFVVTEHDNGYVLMCGAKTCYGFFPTRFQRLLVRCAQEIIEWMEDKK